MRPVKAPGQGRTRVRPGQGAVLVDGDGHRSGKLGLSEPDVPVTVKVTWDAGVWPFELLPHPRANIEN